MLWVLICMVHLIVCSYHVTYAFQSESTLFIWMNVKELLARSSREIWSLSDCFEQGVPWYLGKYRVWIHSETHTWHDKNISQIYCTDKYSQYSSIILPVSLNGWVFVYELSGFGFESSCSHLNFTFRACFEQGVPWHSSKCRVWIHSETRTWHDKNIQYKQKIDW